MLASTEYETGANKCTNRAVHTFQFDGKEIFMSKVKTLYGSMGDMHWGSEEAKKEEFTYTFCNSFR